MGASSGGISSGGISRGGARRGVTTRCWVSRSWLPSGGLPRGGIRRCGSDGIPRDGAVAGPVPRRCVYLLSLRLLFGTLVASNSVEIVGSLRQLGYKRCRAKREDALLPKKYFPRWTIPLNAKTCLDRAEVRGRWAPVRGRCSLIVDLLLLTLWSFMIKYRE